MEDQSVKPLCRASNISRTKNKSICSSDLTATIRHGRHKRRKEGSSESEELGCGTHCEDDLKLG